MTTEHRKTESDDYLCQLRQDALDRPTDFDAFLKLGDAYLDEQEMQNATLAYKKAVQLAPKHELTHQKLGETYLKL